MSQDGLPIPLGLLGEILLASKTIDQEQLDAALELQKESRERLGTVLVQTGAITPAQLTEALASQYGLRVVSLERVQPRPEGGQGAAQGAGQGAAGGAPLAHVGSASTSRWATRPARGSSARSPRRSRWPGHLRGRGRRRHRRAIDKAYKSAATVTDAVRVFEARVSERAGTGRHGHRRRRQRARGAGGQPDPHPGGARPGVRRAHRAHGRPGAGAQPHRRRAPRGAHAAPGHGAGAGEPHQDHGRHEHRRASASRRTARSRRWSTAASSTSG
jgi:hypothetical protein